MEFWTTPLGWTLATTGAVLLVTVGVLIAVAFLLLADRKIWAGVQLRKGPNVVGPFGLLQSFADFFKFVLKEIVIPAGSDKVVFILAPLISFVLAFIASGVVIVSVFFMALGLAAVAWLAWSLIKQVRADTHRRST